MSGQGDDRLTEKPVELKRGAGPSPRGRGEREGPAAKPREGEGPARSPTSNSARVCVGVITGAHGVHGAVRIKSFTAEPEAVASYGPLEDERGQRQFALRLIGDAKGVLIARIPGIEDRDKAEALRGMRLYVPRAALPPTGEDEFYHADLLGLEAVLADGTIIGRVRAVHDFGAGDTLELVRPQGQPVMVPFTRAIVPVVDIAGGRLVIDAPPGLLTAEPETEAEAEQTA